MVKHFTRELVAERAIIVETPKVSHEVDRSFELPKGLYVATVALYLGFLAVMAAGLSTPGLILPMAIFSFFILAGFGLPTIWTRMQPEHRSRNMSWSRLVSQGIATHTGRVSARDAAVQVLILPVLIFCWGIVAVTIAALV
jgi:hypothetical protein